MNISRLNISGIVHGVSMFLVGTFLTAILFGMLFLASSLVSDHSNKVASKQENSLTIQL